MYRPMTVEVDQRLAKVVDVLRAAHPTFTPVTIRRLVDRVAVSVDFLAGSDLHAVVVHDEAERQLTYVD